jgi:hypothetical protein
VSQLPQCFLRHDDTIGVAVVVINILARYKSFFLYALLFNLYTLFFTLNILLQVNLSELLSVVHFDCVVLLLLFILSTLLVRILCLLFNIKCL